jgi:uncharacterized iron-regulated protein
MLGPAFNLYEDTGDYLVSGCMWNEDEESYDTVRSSWANSVQEAASIAKQYLDEYDDIDSAIVTLPTGTQVVINADKYYTEDEIYDAISID